MKKYNKKLIKNIFTVVFVLVLIFWLFQIDWNNFSSRANSGAFFGVLAGALFIISLQIKNKVPKE
ncbi:hypothetical protein [Polaribacter sp. SA4-12]|uniref:hypothetical protein n=1 Tax=Polaribacter sp. SA4-12 TaxID=1312072 RepID=UPI000B3C0A42|nr:hypothetical protein [Polaribacter sp. SA4-12]ARV13888.1 hypothetical protein BTO07_01445 [Polaribacter sp. SA4-12]